MRMLIIVKISGGMRMNQPIIRFGIIGTNKITEEFLKAAMSCEGFKLNAVYSRTEERGREFAASYDVEHVYTDLEQLLKDDVVDAMYIASPNAYHAKQAILCLNHQKHVLCEKPLASNLKEVEAMCEAALKNEVVLMEAMKTTVLPTFKVVKENLHKLGTIRRYFASFCQYSSRYDAYRSGTVLNTFNKDLSNGALVDIGVYTIAPMVHLFGTPQEIKASAYLLDSGVDGEGSVIFSYPNSQACVMYSKISNSHLPSEIQGEEGTMVIDRINRFNRVTIHYRNKEVEELALPHEEADMKYELEEFIQTILNKKRESTINTLERSKQVMMILDEVRRQIGLEYLADLK